MFRCEFFEVVDVDLQRYEQAYPAVNIEGELRKMDCWLRANPARRKKQYSRFINNWLAKTHGRLQEAEIGAMTREHIRREQERTDAMVGKWKGYR